MAYFPTKNNVERWNEKKNNYNIARRISTIKP